MYAMMAYRLHPVLRLHSVAAQTGLVMALEEAAQHHADGTHMRRVPMLELIRVQVLRGQQFIKCRGFWASS